MNDAAHHKVGGRLTYIATFLAIIHIISMTRLKEKQTAGAVKDLEERILVLLNTDVAIRLRRYSLKSTVNNIFS